MTRLSQAPGPVPREPIRATLHRLLLRRILDGSLPPGRQLMPASLAGELGVSATPVREALIELEQDGFLDNPANRGFAVRRLTAREAEELYPLIWTLEALALRSAPPGEATLAELDALNARFARETEPQALQGLDVQWHEHLVRECPNDTLHQMLTVLKRRVYRYEDASLRHSGGIPGSSDEHRRIAECLRRGNVEDAVGLLEENWRKGLRFLLPWLARDGTP